MTYLLANMLYQNTTLGTNYGQFYSGPFDAGPLEVNSWTRSR